MSQPNALVQRLAVADEEVDELFRAYFAPVALAEIPRGALVQQIVERCTALDAAREELLHELVSERGDTAVADELDRRSLKRRELLHELYTLIRNVVPADIFASEPERIDGLVRALDERRRADLSFERASLAGIARDRRVEPRLRELSGRLDEVLERAPTHPTGHRLAHRRTPLGARLHRAVDKLRDHPDSGSRDDPAGVRGGR